MNRIKKRLSLVLTVCLLATCFTFVPSAYAAEEPGNTVEQEPEAVSLSDTEYAVPFSSTPGFDPNARVYEAEEPGALYAITTVAGEGGTVTVDKSSAQSGETVTYTVTPKEGYKIKSIRLGEDAVNVTDAGTTFTGTFTVMHAVTISATFAKNATYKIDTSVNYTSRGTITADATVEEGGSKTVKATPKAGYYLKDLLVDGESVGALSSYTFEDIDQNHTVKAVFAKQIKIMLDPGHYGSSYNRSNVYPSYYESNMTWNLYGYLREELEEYDGFKVGTTRTSKAVDRDVYYRGTASKGYDLFLSLHSNATSSSSVDYPLIIKQKSSSVSAPSSLTRPLGQAIEDTMGTRQAAKTITKTNSDGRTEYYGVLRGAAAVGTTGMILEHSFHTNLAAAKWLSQYTNLKRLAKAEAEVLANYYGMEEGGSGGMGSDDPDDREFESEPSDAIVRVTKNVNVRKGPYTDTTKYYLAKPGEVYQLQATARDGRWGQIKNSGYWFCLDGYTEPATEDDLYGVVSSTEKVKVVVGSLNMRQKPDTSSKSMGYAKKNTTYQLQAKAMGGDWGQLKSNGYWIYLKNGYTEKVVTKKVVSTTEKVKVIVSDLNMRASYTANSAKKGTAKKGTIYQLKAKTSDGTWGQLKSNGYWISLSSKYVQKVTGSSGEKEVVSTTEKVKVLVSNLNIRASYTANSAKKGTAKKGTIYQLKAKTSDGEWGQLKSNGYWINLGSKYVQKVTASGNSKVVSTTEKVKVLVGSLTFRSSYSTSSAKKGTAKKNTVYQLKAKTRDGEWGQIKSNGYWIYLKNGYTKKV